MTRTLSRFPRNEIMSLTEQASRFDLAESVGPDILLRDLLTTGEADEMESLSLGYGTAAGDPVLRRKIAAVHGVDPDDVVITVGGMHALFLIGFILCAPGDEAVTTAPLFPGARNALAAVGADIKTLDVRFDEGYRIDPERLRLLLSPKTRLISLASPQNPSGVAVPLETLEEILALMNEICPDAYLLVDETYREAAYGDDGVMPGAADLDDRIVSCTSLSKCHGAPGLRLGWAITRDEALREQLVLGKFTTVISCSLADEALALRVLERAEEIVGQRRRHLQGGLTRTAAWVEANGDLVEWIRPDAGALCCMRLRQTVFDDAAVARFYHMLGDADVRVASGAWFGEDARIFRLGFGLLPMPDLEAGLDLLSRTLRRVREIAGADHA